MCVSMQPPESICHGNGKWRRGSVGSTAGQVARHSNCMMLAQPAAQQALTSGRCS